METIKPHRAECQDCDGSGRNTGYACCGGQGCSTCSRECDTCGGECSVEGYVCNDENVTAEQAAEIHSNSEPDIECRVEDCPDCARELAENGPPDSALDRERARERREHPEYFCKFD